MELITNEQVTEDRDLQSTIVGHLNAVYGEDGHAQALKDMGEELMESDVICDY